VVPKYRYLRQVHASVDPMLTRPWAAGSAAGLVVVLLVVLVGWSCGTQPMGAGDTAVALASAPRGRTLYAQHCVACHGETGRGDGDAARYLFPPPRDFTASFRLVSTANGVPTEDDLRRTLGRGMPGSSMPAFSWLAPADIEALAHQVRALAYEGWVLRLQLQGLLPEPARERARQAVTPGPRIDPGPPADDSAATLARGRQLYLEKCAACHGPEGQGQVLPPWDQLGRFQWPRDFTAGILKGEATHEELVWRIRAGLPGTTMLPTEFERPGDEAAVARWVQHLAEPMVDRLVQRPQRVVARRVAALPADADDPAWSVAEEIRVVLAPLNWRAEAAVAARMAFVHDGARLAARVRWHDPTRDDRAVGTTEHPDAAALQLSSDPEPALFGMGTPAHPVHIWLWKPFRAGDASALLDAMNRPPHRTADAPVYLGAPEVARELRGEGVQSAVGFAGGGVAIDARASWHDGEWSVVFTRALGEDADLALTTGNVVRVACAVWDGTTRQSDADKSFSIWHDLVLEE
jgi:DMSO reductase family type II enzyme heme b subunit